MENFYETNIEISSRNVNYIEELGISIKEKITTQKGKSLYKQCLLTTETKNRLKDKYIKFPNEINILGFSKIKYNHVWRVYCDGSSYNNGGKNPNKPTYGGYGVIVTYDNNEVFRHYYAEAEWTNNIGELSGALEGLSYIINCTSPQFLPEDCIMVITDSQYVSKGCTEWMAGWIKRKWKNNTNQLIANVLLWKSMKNKYLDHYNIYFEWVKGHTLLEDISSQYNEECDELAKRGVDELVKGIK